MNILYVSFSFWFFLFHINIFCFFSFFEIWEKRDIDGTWQLTIEKSCLSLRECISSSSTQRKKNKCSLQLVLYFSNSMCLRDQCMKKQQSKAKLCLTSKILKNINLISNQLNVFQIVLWPNYYYQFL